MKTIHKKLQGYHSQITKLMIADRLRIKKQLRKLGHRVNKGLSGKALDRMIADIEGQIHQARQYVDQRRNYMPSQYPLPDLPITKHRKDIIKAITNNQVVIVSGDTGSGKTTQLPRFCLAAGRGVLGTIGCTQPRRIAAITVANRIAEELNEPIGRSVGYKIRFKEKISEESYIKIMTDGILLAETQGDPYLNQYDTIIVDEAHERSLNIDFILGILKKLIHRRKDLKLIITSATIDTLKFSKAFGNAPIIEVSGRTFPVETHYISPESNRSRNTDLTHVDMVINAVENLLSENSRGDILIFLPTEQDIRETCDLLIGRKLKHVRIFPLFARLPASEQKTVFTRFPERKIIVATNIAETSITIPGIRYVIDTGLARISQYTPSSRITALPVMPISRSSADQRMGRCGRMENGVCIRLFSEEEYRDRPLYTQPEILRSNLAEVILRMLFLNLGRPDEFPFIDPPNEKNIRDGFKLLHELGAIKPSQKPFSSRRGSAPTGSQKIGSGGIPPYKLTPIGRLLAKMPIDPRLSRIIVEAHQRSCLDQVVIIASAMSIQDPRERPLDMEKEADEAHQQFRDSESDFITLLNIWRVCENNTLGGRRLGPLKKLCKSSFLSFRRMREWQDIHQQISFILRENGYKVKRNPEAVYSRKDLSFSQAYMDIHKSILSGFLANAAQKKEKFYFRAARHREVMVFPGSGIFDSCGPWIVAAEMVETSRLFARTCANIEAHWLEEIGTEQCKRSYNHPRWSRKKGAVLIDEQVSLYGLIIVPKRTVPYGPVNPVHATEIFIRQALIPGDINARFSFLTHNLSLDQSVEDLENRIRRKDIRVDDEDLFLFYTKHVSNVYDIPTLKQLIREKGSDEFLKLKIDDFMRYDPDPDELANYPTSLELGEGSFPLQYKFESGHEQDGVTLSVPATMATDIESEQTDWLVPGLFNEKIETLIKGLPKKHRKKLVPISNSVNTICKKMPRFNGPLATALSRFLYTHMDIDIPANAWPLQTLPDHLKMRVALLDSQKKEIMAGRDILQLRNRLNHHPDPDLLSLAKKEWEKHDILEWNFEDLPDRVIITTKDKTRWTLYPGLEIEADQLNLRLFTDMNKAIDSHKKGVAHLFSRHFSKEIKYLKRNLILTDIDDTMVLPYGGRKAMEKMIFECVSKALFQADIRKKEHYINQLKQLESAGIHRRGQNLLHHTKMVLKSVYDTRLTFRRLESIHHNRKGLLEFIANLEHDLTKLVPVNFLKLYEMERLPHIVRYSKGLKIRAERGVLNYDKDRNKEKVVSVFTSKLQQLISELSPQVSTEKRTAVEDLFWLLEEFKISLFAQELKTAIRVSEKILNKTIHEIEHMI